MANDNNRDRQNPNQEEPSSRQTRPGGDRDSQQSRKPDSTKPSDDQDEMDENDEDTDSSVDETESQSKKRR